MDRISYRPSRRRVLVTFAALACAGLRPSHANAATAAAAAPGPVGNRTPRRIVDMIGTNGWPGSAADIEMWRKMGINWGRGSVGPGQPDAPTEPMRVDKTGNRYDSNLPSVVLRNS